MKPARSNWEQDWLRVTRPIRVALQPFVAEYRELLKRLRAEGFRVRWTSQICPVQLEGHLPSGEKFYFRCRHNTCSLAIAPRGGDPVGAPVWRQEVSRWDAPAAGGLTASEAEPVLRELLAQYAQYCQHQGTSRMTGSLSKQKRIQRALSLAGAWKHLDDEDGPDMLDAFDRLRHETKPSPPFVLEDGTP